MSTTYTLWAKELNSSYQQLTELAQTYKEKASTDPFEPLSDADFIKYAAENRNTFQLKFHIANGNSINVHDTKVLKQTYKLLCQADAEDGHIDGKIALSPTRQNLIIYKDSDVTQISDDSLNTWKDFYKNSIFVVTTINKPFNDATPSGLASIINKTQNEDGTYTYLLITARTNVDSRFEDEDSYSLESISGDTVFSSQIELVGCDPAAGLAVLKLNTSIDLNVIPLLPKNEEMPDNFPPIMQIAKQATAGTLADSEYWNEDDGYYDIPFDPFIRSRVNLNQRGDMHGNNMSAPILNSEGQLVGLIYANSEDPVDVSIITPVSLIHSSIQNIIDHQSSKAVTYGDWGIDFTAFFGDEIRKSILPDSINNGVIVSRIEENGPAMLAGLKTGDIIFSINSKTNIVNLWTETEMGKIWSLILKSKSTEQIKFGVYRPSTRETLTLYLTPRNSVYPVPNAFATKQGFNVYDMTPRGRWDMELPDNIQGVFIYEQTRDDKNMPKYELTPGLFEGHLIVSLDETPTPDVATFKALWNEKNNKPNADKPIIIKTYNPSNHKWSFAVVYPEVGGE